MIKKIVLFIHILLILFSINLFADDDLFKTFQLNYVVLDSLDVVSTLYGVKHGLYEKNPLAKWHIKNPSLTFVLHYVLNLATIKITDIVFKGNERLGWIVIIGLNLIKGYIVYRNFKILWG